MKFICIMRGKPRKSNENGQTLVIVVFLSIIALILGVTVSLRYLTNVRDIAQTDSSSRALAVAEASVERILLLPTETLEGYINSGNCGSDCYLQIPGADGINAEAAITLSYLGNTSEAYPISLKKDNSGEVNLNGYPNTTNVSVCWNNTIGDLPSVTALYVYGNSGSYDADAYSYNSVGSTHSDNSFSQATAQFGYQNCFTITGKAAPNLLRLKSFYSDVLINIVPASGASIPTQGILISSEGRVSEQIRKIEVIKTLYHMPTQFDYVLYQKSNTDALSN